MHGRARNSSQTEVQGREDGLRRALQSIENVTIQKEQSITQKAKDVAAGAGESDLRRLERQFASLKNTYMLYDTKEHFLDGLLDGLPDGQEEEILQELEERVKAQGAKVKQSKSSTAEMQEQITALISKAAELHEELGRERAAAKAHLDRLASSSAAVNRTRQQELPQLPEGPDEEQCTEALAQEAAVARQLESSIASDEAHAAELAASIKAEEAELQLLQAQLHEAEATGQKVQQVGVRGQAGRYGAIVGWCQEIQGVLAALSGVTVLRFEEDRIAVRLLTSFHTSWEPTGEAVHSVEHELALALTSGSATLAGAELSPADVDISDIVEAAQHNCGGFEFVVREVHARLATRMCRAALIKEAEALFKLQPYESGSTSLHAVLPKSGTQAQLTVPLQWPAKGVPLQLNAISTVLDSADLLQAMALMQHRPELAYGSIPSLLHAVDEAVSEILTTAEGKK